MTYRSRCNKSILKVRSTPGKIVEITPGDTDTTEGDRLEIGLFGYDCRERIFDNGCYPSDSIKNALSVSFRNGSWNILVRVGESDYSNNTDSAKQAHLYIASRVISGGLNTGSSVMDGLIIA